MLKRYALYAEAGDGDGAGGGAPGGGSPEGGPGKDGGEKQVPESRLRAALRDQEQRLTAAFEAKLAELKAAPKSDPPKRYTKAQLSAAVEAGQITQEQADQTWEAQVQQDAMASAERVALETVSAAERQRHINAELNRYLAAAPEIGPGSDDPVRQRIQDEYNYLVKTLGDEPNVTTQLKAVRAVLGPIERLEKSRSGRDQRESHRETGGEGGGGGEPRKTGKLADRLHADARRHYEKQIESGRYKDWSEVEAELKYASPGTRQRLGIA